MFRLITLAVALGLSLTLPVATRLDAQTVAQPAVAATKAQLGAVRVKGPGGDTATLTAQDLKAMRRYDVKVGWGGGHTYSGAALSDILATVGAPSEVRLHGPALDQVVVVTGRDGFIAVLAIAETAMSLKGQPVILADTEDGAPLNAKEGPYRLVIGGEAKPPRSVWGVVAIELRKVTR
jgi:hypothetical protein